MSEIAGPDHLAEIAASRCPGRRQLRVSQFDDWHRDLDDALRILPATPDCPPDLLRLLAAKRGVEAKRTALVLDGGIPVAVLPLCRTGWASWRPVTHYVVPGQVLPAEPGRLIEAVEALNLTVSLAFWRSPEPLPAGPRIRGLLSSPTRGMSFAEDFVAFWKTSHLWTALRGARNRCKDLPLAINAPGAARWVIVNWAEKWGVPAGEREDRLAAADYLEGSGKHFTLTLSDRGRMVAGITCVVHEGEAVAHCSFRYPEYKYHQVGNHILRLLFEWARDAGLNGIDIGSGFAYKARFAPLRGVKHEFTVTASLPKYHLQRAVSAARAGARRWLAGAPPKAPGNADDTMD
ncbi:GNAT family N-acetyltransferase [Chelatococcus sp. SYSU_G07232]|uniref:GNAT family N-acetyltransferase n=1 Tax=Chelatococcus albus TaxID=3047466 RepID=A0ABT7ACI9_9HYPH|nr:GNAT family N-acetyltransferase [Chelatococcus sp. SYSU_G07232]MDJ1157085.1 GNAT family N-acetyltransferase [Chelatococcus sp. SYSU_G07232]